MKYFKKSLSVGLGICIALTNTIILTKRARAYPIPTQTYDMVSEDDLSSGILAAPDFSSITLNSLGSFSESGSISNQYDREVGYGLGRQWQQGDLIVEVLKLGDLAESFGVGNFTLEEIIIKSGRELNRVSLDQFGFLNKQTVTQFIQANPQLIHLSVQDVPPLADLVRQVYGNNNSYLQLKVGNLIVQKEFSNKRIDTFAWKDKQRNSSHNTANIKAKTFAKNISYPSQIAADDSRIELSQIIMGENLDLSQYTLEDVSGSDNTLVQDYANWQDTYVSEVEGLSSISLDNFPNPITTTLNFISRVDMFWGDAENQVKSASSVSGSDKQGYAVPCNFMCAHIELDDLENSGRDLRIAEGKRWVIGKDPDRGAICPNYPWGVEGGHGALGLLNCGKEPTGRNSFGPQFKVAIWDVDEVAETAETAIFFRYCGTFVGCTPYFIGPIPWLPINKGDWLILGPGF